jgi:hypothetical protein
MSVWECMLENWWLIAIAVGLIFAAAVTIAVVLAVDIASTGVAVPLTTLILEQLLAMWLPITASVLASIAGTYQLCVELTTPPPAVVVAVGATAALAMVTTAWALYKGPLQLRPRKG